MSSEALGKLWRLPLKALGINLSEARELAALLEETLPDLRVDFHLDGPIQRSSTPSQLRGPSFKDRLTSGAPIPIGEQDAAAGLRGERALAGVNPLVGPAVYGGWPPPGANPM